MDTAMLVPPPSNQQVLNEIKAMTGQLREIKALLGQQPPAQDIFSFPLLTTQRIQASRIVIFQNAVAVINFRVGSRTVITIETQTSGILDFPFPVTLEQGVQATWINNASGAELVYGPSASPVHNIYLIGIAEDPHRR